MLDDDATVESVATMMGGFGATELLVVMGIVLLLFGAKRLPELASGMGTAVLNFKTSLRDDEDHQVRALPPSTRDTTHG